EDLDAFNRNATASVDWLVALIEHLHILLLEPSAVITVASAALWLGDVRSGGAFHGLHRRVGREQVA
ncbi:MAG: hypothetical protein M1826_003764, partial [Phylliscum demangeonii]